MGTAAIFELEVERLLAALAHEVFGEVGVALFAGGLGEFDECHFGDFVPGIAVQLAVGGAESGIDVISETAGRVEQLAFAGGLIVGNRAFGQVAEAVQLMVVLQVGEVPVHAVEDVVGVQVAVVELRRADDIDGGVGGRFKVSVRVVGQRVADRFDPFGEISVLEHEAVELVGIGVRRVVRQGFEAAERVFRRHEGLAFLVVFCVLRGGGLEVVHAVAGCGAGNVVVQRVPLVGNHLGAHEFLPRCPERVGDGGVAQCDWMAGAIGGSHECKRSLVHRCLVNAHNPLFHGLLQSTFRMAACPTGIPPRQPAQDGRALAARPLDRHFGLRIYGLRGRAASRRGWRSAAQTLIMAYCDS